MKVLRRKELEGILPDSLFGHVDHIHNVEWEEGRKTSWWECLKRVIERAEEDTKDDTYFHLRSRTRAAAISVGLATECRKEDRDFVLARKNYCFDRTELVFA